MTGQQFADPNREAVGLEPAWAEGSGGSDTSGGGGPPETERLDAMTKAELLEEAAARGVDADPAMTKADIRAALDGAQEGD